MAVAVLMMVVGTEGLNYTTNGWECTPEAIARSSFCKTECDAFTELVKNQEVSESDSDSDKKKRCKIAAKTVMEIMDAMMMGLPSSHDIHEILANRPMDDVTLVHSDPRSGIAAMRSAASSPVPAVERACDHLCAYTGCPGNGTVQGRK